METEETQVIETQQQQERGVGVVQDKTGSPENAPKLDSLDRKDAIREAIAKHSGEKKEAPAPTEQPTATEAKTAVDDPDIEPPQEFSAEAKQAWRNKDYKRVNQEYRRLHDARTAEISRAQIAVRDANNEAKTWRQLGEVAKPYIEARGGEGVTPQQAMMEALALIDSFKKADPATVKSELKKLGIDLDAAPGSSTPNPLSHPEIKTLQETVSALVNEREARIRQDRVNEYSQAFAQLASLKTRTGDPVFPGFYDGSEAGMQFAAKLGSLTREPVFIDMVRHRIPNATKIDLVREAYIQLGGKVSGAPVTVSTSNQQTEKSRRAAASTPGRPSSPRTSSSQIGQLDRKAAIRAAIAEYNGGH